MSHPSEHLKRIKVHTQEALEDPTYRFPGNYGVEKFLEIFSSEVTTNRVSDTNQQNAGGVCEKNGVGKAMYE